MLDFYDLRTINSPIKTFKNISSSKLLIQFVCHVLTKAYRRHFSLDSLVNEADEDLKRTDKIQLVYLLLVSRKC